MSTSQHPLVLVAEAGGAEICRRQLPYSNSIRIYTLLGPHRRALKCLTRAQRSEPSPSQTSPPQEPDTQSSNVPSWAQPGSSEPPPWERKQAAPDQAAFEVPFYAYLLASVVVAIAAVGSIFEYFNKKAVFGVILPDSPFYAPILGFFVFGGFPAAAFLWLKSIELANKAARDQDREDGFLD
ncbi:hypothetical protein GOP47_0001928 [Adiantum capillus-veneris]|uniref:Uncharacterized protein n=1 Tax=Adiantum capillus-veneris TaxID=13818 RepID=A0A9D4V970_ADICA|nr:hypothetical protein GOP47_0001928 [Adiantum capillus-veneris]